MLRAIGIAAGAATQLLFLYTVWQLFRFLYADMTPSPSGSLLVDLGLALSFAVPHSLLLHPRTRKRWFSWVPRDFYGCFFCVATCVSLLALFAAWRSAEPSVWQLTGVGRALCETLFFASWIALFYSLYLSGLGYQTGLTPWWYWLRRQPQPEREFRVESLYRVLRHPIYLSFLGLIWFNPVMTLDRLLLAVVWTVYIFVGSHLKDERLAFYLGARYRRYQQQVPGFPLWPWGALGRHKQSRGEPAQRRRAASHPG